MLNKKYISIFTAFILLFSFSACKKKTASIEETLKQGLTEHIRITNDVFYERGKDTGKGTTLRIVAPIKVAIAKDGIRAVTDTVIEINYIGENKSTKAPLRVTWEFKDGKWAADTVLPEDFGFIIAFDQTTLEQMKK